MTLLEVVVSSVVLAGSSSAALGVWNQAATEIQRATQLDELALQLETARIATDRWLQSDAAASVVIDSSSADCRFRNRIGTQGDVSTPCKATLVGGCKEDVSIVPRDTEARKSLPARYATCATCTCACTCYM